MKPTAFLINLARGGVLDEAALIEHLQAGKIAGAGLDIFSKQPLPPDNPLWRMPNVIITPNIGGRSDKFVEQTMTIVEPNLAAFLDGRLKDLRNSSALIAPCDARVSRLRAAELHLPAVRGIFHSAAKST